MRRPAPLLAVLLAISAPAFADSVPGINLALSTTAPGLADVVIHSASRQPYAGKPTSIIVYAYMAPEPLDRVAPTAMFLARAVRATCNSGWAQVRMMRNDVPWAYIKPSAAQRYSKIADAYFDPDKIADQDDHLTFSLVRLTPLSEIQQSEMFYKRFIEYQGQGVDDQKAERSAIRDVKKAFGIKGDWYVPPGNTTKRLELASIKILDAPDRGTVAGAIRPLCNGYKAGT